MADRFNLLFPEWQGYGASKDVHEGAIHFCQHIAPSTYFNPVEVKTEEKLVIEEGILGLSAFERMLTDAHRVIDQANPEEIFMMGGTCACELAPVSYLNKKYDGDLAVFWFDAHGDLNTPTSSPSNRLHGMPLRSLMGEGEERILQHVKKILGKEQVALVGSRDLDTGELIFIEEQQIPIFKLNQLSHTSELIDFVRKSGFTNAYIHFDLDVLDPQEFSQVLVATPEGLSLKVAIEGAALIRKHMNVVGCSIVEYCPRGGGGEEQLKQLIHSGFGLQF